MQDKLSIKKVYKNAIKYVAHHLFAFLFLTVFYFLGSLLPMFIGGASLKMLALLMMFFYSYIFFYFAAGCYYKQQVLLDLQTFFTATLRFLTTILLFLAAILLSSFVINLGFSFVRSSFFGGDALVYLILHNTTWLIGKYLFIFLLFVIFFIIPSFAFVSEITGKSRSILAAYAKTRGNVLRIAIVAAISFFLLLLVLAIFAWVSPFIAAFARAIMLVFITIVYFKLYDFFYKLPQNKRSPKVPAEPENDRAQNIMLAGAVKDTKEKGLFTKLTQKGEDKDVNQG